MLFTGLETATGKRCLIEAEVGAVLRGGMRPGVGAGWWLRMCREQRGKAFLI